MNHGEKNQQQVIRRQYSQCTSSVEAAEVLRLFLGVEQNAGDQKSRENEEQIHAQPAGCGREQEKPRQATEVKTAVLPIETVQQKHADYRDTAHGVQLRHHWPDERIGLCRQGFHWLEALQCCANRALKRERCYPTLPSRLRKEELYIGSDLRRTV